MIKIEGSHSEGKYIIRRKKFTKDNENDQNLSDDSGFFIMYRNDNDKNWTISKTKNNFNQDKDYQNNIDSLDITTPRSKKTSFLLRNNLSESFQEILLKILVSFQS